MVQLQVPYTYRMNKMLPDNIFISDKKRKICDMVEDIIKEGKGGSFFVMDMDEMVTKVIQWRKLLPTVQLYYAVKCSDDPAVLKVLASMNTGFDCASMSEMEKILQLGVPESKIIFANPCKEICQLKAAKDMGVSLMTFDNILELHNIKTYYPTAQLVLRFRYDDMNALYKLGDKFGAELWDTKKLLTTAKELHLNIVGVAFHVGSASSNPQVFYQAIACARKVFDEATEEGFTPWLVDIGGGFPSNDDNMMENIATQINTSLSRYFPHHPSLQVIGEPGRYVVGSAFTLATQVIGRRDQMDQEGSQQHIKYYINDSIYGSFYFSIFKQYPQPCTLKQMDGEKYVWCEVWGQTCSCHDLILPGIYLPPLTPGSWLLWHNMGAYTLTIASNFNGFPKPRLYIMASKAVWDNLEYTGLKMDKVNIEHNHSNTNHGIDSNGIHRNGRKGNGIHRNGKEGNGKKGNGIHRNGRKGNGIHRNGKGGNGKKGNGIHRNGKKGNGIHRNGRKGNGIHHNGKEGNGIHDP